jgi:DNA-binding XRE family transcriptional regulator
MRKQHTADNHFGERLNKYRKRAGLSQADMGKVLGFSGRMVGLWESGRADVARSGAFAKLEPALATYSNFKRLVSAPPTGKTVLLIGGNTPPVQAKFAAGIQLMGLDVPHRWSANADPGRPIPPVDYCVIIKLACPGTLLTGVRESCKSAGIPLIEVGGKWSRAQHVLRAHGLVGEPKPAASPVTQHPALPKTGWVMESQIATTLGVENGGLSTALEPLGPPHQFRLHGEPVVVVNAWPEEQVNQLLRRVNRPLPPVIEVVELEVIDKPADEPVTSPADLDGGESDEIGTMHHRPDWPQTDGTESSIRKSLYSKLRRAVDVAMDALVSRMVKEETAKVREDLARAKTTCRDLANQVTELNKKMHAERDRADEAELEVMRLQEVSETFEKLRGLFQPV